MLKRHKEIIYKILSHPQGISGKELSKFCNVTLRTVRSDIKSLNDQLSADDSKIEADKVKGYYISDSSKEKINRLLLNEQDFSGIPQTHNERTIYLLLRLAFSTHAISIDEFAERMVASDTTINLNINAARRFLREYFPTLYLKKISGSLIHLDGEEDSRRNLVSGLLSHHTDKKVLKSYTRFLFNSNDFYTHVENLITLLCKNLESNDIFLTGQGYYSFAIDIALVFERSNYEMTRTDLNHIFKPWFKTLMNQLETYFSKELPIKEWDYLQKRLQTKQFSSRTTYLPFNVTEASHLVRDFIQISKEKYNIDLESDDILIEHLTLHMCSTIHRIDQNCYTENPFKYSIQREHLYLLVLAQEMATLLKEKSSSDMKFAEISYVALYLLAALKRKRKKQKIILVCDYGDSVITMVQNNIEEFFGGNLEVKEVCASHQLYNIYKEHNDVSLIISSVNVSTVLTADLPIPIVYVSPIITESEKQLIEKTSAYYLNKSTEFHSNSIDFFDPSLYIHYETDVSLQEVIKRLTNIHFKEDKEDILGLNYENPASSIFKNKQNILILQPNIFIGRKTRIGVATLKKPLLYKRNKYQIVLMLFIQATDIDKIIDLYHTVSLIINNEIAKDLTTCKSYESFMQKIKLNILS